MKTCSVVFGLLLASGASWAQQYIISTIAGGAPPPTPVAALTASIGPGSVKTDTTGNVYFTSSNCVFKLGQSGVLTRIAGNGRGGYSGDGGPATNAQLNPGGLAIDGVGNLFIADYGSNRVRKVSTSGIITTVAGNGGFSGEGDGGPATSASLNFPEGVAVDGAGNLFIAGFDNRVRRVSPSGIITAVAGNGNAGFSGDGGPATNAEFYNPQDIAVDGSGNLFIADYDNHRVRKVAASGIITTVAGNGNQGFSGDGGLATSASLAYPTGVAVDGAGNLFIADVFNSRVRKVSTSGIITTVVGNGNRGFSGDGGPATNAQSEPRSVAVDGASNLLIADGYRVRKVSTSGIVTTVAGNGDDGSGDGGLARDAQLIAGAVAVDGAGNLFIAGYYNSRVRKVSTSGFITTVAGDGDYGFSGDGGPATNARLKYPEGLAVDGAGNLFIADPDNGRVRKVSTSGIITTVAGNGSCCFSGDGGPATNAQLGQPSGVAVDRVGNLFIADGGNHRVRKVSTSGIITTVAGNGIRDGPFGGFSGDGGPATNAALNGPSGLAVDGAGNLFIADGRNDRVRKVSTSGIITTVAGNGASIFSGDGGPATNAQLAFPKGIAVDGAGNLFIADSSNARVRKVSASGIITTVAGNGTYGFSGDGGPATNAQLNDPSGVAVDGAGNIYVGMGGAVRLLKPTSQSVLIGTVVDAASQAATPASPGKIVVIYGAGLGPSELAVASPSNGTFGTQLAGTTVSFNGIASPIIYTSAAQVAAIVPYAISGTTANVTVAYQSQASAAFSVPVAASAPSFFTLNQTGAGQAASINALDGTFNTAVSPVKIGGYVSLFATGEGQTTPAGVDGKLATLPLPHPNLPVTVSVGGIPATVQYSGAVFGTVAGLMQINVQNLSGVQPGGYVPVVLKVGNASTVDGAMWIAVAGN